MTNIATPRPVLAKGSCCVMLCLCCWIDWIGPEGESQGSKPKRLEGCCQTRVSIPVKVLQSSIYLFTNTYQVVDDNEGSETFRTIVPKGIISNNWSGVSFLCMTYAPFSYVLARVTQNKPSYHSKTKTNQLVGIHVG